MKISPPVCLSLFLALLLGTAPVQSAEPSLGAGSLRFMEEFAVKLYNRGNVRQATKEFERIRRIDPSNTIAKEYLVKVGQKTLSTETPTGTSSIDGITEISEDIRQLKNEIAEQERNTEILKNTLRNSLAENDNLYSALDKRSREVMELRAKLYATPYGKDYKELMGEFDTDRIPQRAFSNKDILPAVLGTETPAVMDAPLFAEALAANEAKLEILRTQGNYDPMKIAEFEKKLDEQRATLAEKNGALAEQTNTLVQINTEVTAINQEIKTTDANYTASARGLEEKYEAMKNDLSKTTASDQKIFLDLMTDYITNVKTLQEFRTAANDRATKMKELTTTLKNNEETINALNEQIRLKDAAIENYKKLLAAASIELDAKAALIKEKDAAIIESSNELNASNKTLIAQKNELIQAGKGLNTINTTLAGVQGLLESTDTEMSGLQREIDAMKAFITRERQHTNEQTAAIAVLSENASQKTGDLQSLQERIKALSLPIGIPVGMPVSDPAAMNTQTEKINAIADKLGAFTEQAKDLRSIIDDKDKEIRALKELLFRTEEELSAQSLALNERDEVVLGLEEKLATTDRKMSYMSDIIAGKKSLDGTELEKLSSLAAVLKKESSTLQDTLLSKDEQIVNMNRYLLNKDTEIEKLKAATTELEKLKVVVQEKEALAEQLAQEQANQKDQQMETALKTTSLEEAQQQTALNALEARRDLRIARTHLAVLSLDLQEKETSLLTLKNTLNKKNSALDEAEKQVLFLQERLSALEFKQKAMREVVTERDMEVARITRELELAKNELTGANAGNAIQASRIKTLENALLTAQEQLKASEEEAATLKEQANNLRKDLLTAQKLIQTRETKTSDELNKK